MAAFGLAAPLAAIGGSMAVWSQWPALGPVPGGLAQASPPSYPGPQAFPAGPTATTMTPWPCGPLAYPGPGAGTLAHGWMPPGVGMQPPSSTALGMHNVFMGAQANGFLPPGTAFGPGMMSQVMPSLAYGSGGPGQVPAAMPPAMAQLRPGSFIGMQPSPASSYAGVPSGYSATAPVLPFVGSASGYPAVGYQAPVPGMAFPAVGYQAFIPGMAISTAGGQAFVPGMAAPAAGCQAFVPGVAAPAHGYNWAPSHGGAAVFGQGTAAAAAATAVPGPVATWPQVGAPVPAAVPPLQHAPPPVRVPTSGGGLMQGGLRKALFMPVQGYCSRRKKKGPPEAAAAAAAEAGAVDPRAAAEDAIHVTLKAAREPATTRREYKGALEYEEWLQANPHLIERGFDTLETARPKELLIYMQMYWIYKHAGNVVLPGFERPQAAARTVMCALSHLSSIFRLLGREGVWNERTGDGNPTWTKTVQLWKQGYKQKAYREGNYQEKAAVAMHEEKLHALVDHLDASITAKKGKIVEELRLASTAVMLLCEWDTGFRGHECGKLSLQCLYNKDGEQLFPAGYLPDVAMPEELIIRPSHGTKTNKNGRPYQDPVWVFAKPADSPDEHKHCLLRRLWAYMKVFHDKGKPLTHFLFRPLASNRKWFVDLPYTSGCQNYMFKQHLKKMGVYKGETLHGLRRGTLQQRYRANGAPAAAQHGRIRRAETLMRYVDEFRMTRAVPTAGRRAEAVS